MHVIYLHQYFNNLEMAGATRSFHFGSHLVARGHDVTMVTSDRTGLSFESDENGMRVIWIANPYSSDFSIIKRIWSFLRFAVFATRVGLRHSKDASVVFATSTPLTIAIPGIIVSKVRRIPLVLELRDLWPDVPIAMGVIENRIVKWFGWILEYLAYKSASHIITLTPTMRDFVSGKGVDLGKISVVPNIADVKSFDPRWARLDGNFRRVLYCGKLGQAHNPGVLVKLAKAAKERGAFVIFDVVGDGSLKDDLISQCRDDGTLNVTIFFHGAIPRKDVAGWYHKCCASILTMADCELLYRHAVQNKFFDGLASGRPVISCYRGHSSELAELCHAGIILDLSNIEASVDSLIALLSDESRLMEYGVNARQLAEEHFTTERLSKKFSVVLENNACSSVQ